MQIGHTLLPFIEIVRQFNVSEHSSRAYCCAYLRQYLSQRRPPNVRSLLFAFSKLTYVQLCTKIVSTVLLSRRSIRTFVSSMMTSSTSLHWNTVTVPGLCRMTVVPLVRHVVSFPLLTVSFGWLFVLLNWSVVCWRYVPFLHQWSIDH